jgi:hypothetical protein
MPAAAGLRRMDGGVPVGSRGAKFVKIYFRMLIMGLLTGYEKSFSLQT